MEKIGIVGAGAMGSGIAQVASDSDHAVVLFDVNEAQLEKAKAKLAKVMARLVEKGRKTEAQAQAIQERIGYTTSMADFAGCKMVIEAIVERLEVSKACLKSWKALWMVKPFWPPTPHRFLWPALPLPAKSPSADWACTSLTRHR